MEAGQRTKDYSTRSALLSRFVNKSNIIRADAAVVAALF